MIHGNKGKPSNRRIDRVLIQKALSLYTEKYDDFGPTLAQEKLLERDGVEIGAGTLRRELITAGLWKPERSSREYRARQSAREHFGEPVQFDGSRHGWLEGGKARCCLITLIDDAAKAGLSQFFEEETMFEAMSVLKRWIQTYGIPPFIVTRKMPSF